MPWIWLEEKIWLLWVLAHLTKYESKINEFGLRQILRKLSIYCLILLNWQLEGIFSNRVGYLVMFSTLFNSWSHNQELGHHNTILVISWYFTNHWQSCNFFGQDIRSFPDAKFLIIHCQHIFARTSIVNVNYPLSIPVSFVLPTAWSISQGRAEQRFNYWTEKENLLIVYKIMEIIAYLR